VVSPHRGGAVETLVRFRDETNLADVLTRRREAYHETAVAAAASAAGHGSGAQSIHQLERSARLASLPPVDQEPRAILVDRVLPGNVTPADYVAGTYVALKSWARVAMRATVRADGADAIVIELAGDGLEKRLRFTADGCLQAAYRWDASAVPADAVFAPEISLAGEIPLRCEPPTDDWRYPITTVAKSERGLEETVQGIAITPRWPAGMGSALIEL
jgi:hypothetical protein